MLFGKTRDVLIQELKDGGVPHFPAIVIADEIQKLEGAFKLLPLSLRDACS